MRSRASSSFGFVTRSLLQHGRGGSNAVITDELLCSISLRGLSPPQWTDTRDCLVDCPTQARNHHQQQLCRACRSSQPKACCCRCCGLGQKKATDLVLDWEVVSHVHTHARSTNSAVAQRMRSRGDDDGLEGMIPGLIQAGISSASPFASRTSF